MNKTIEQRAKELWRMALTYAANICTQISDEYYGDSLREAAHAASQCHQKLVRNIADPHPDFVNAIAGATENQPAETGESASAAIWDIIEEEVGKAYDVGHTHGGNAFRIFQGEPAKRVDDGWAEHFEAIKKCVTDLINSEAGEWVRVEDARKNIVTDEELDKAWGYANFGATPKRTVVLEALTKIIQGYHNGRTATHIVTDLGLIESRNNGDYYVLTDKGLKYLLPPPPQTKA